MSHETETVKLPIFLKDKPKLGNSLTILYNYSYFQLEKYRKKKLHVTLPLKNITVKGSGFR